jgi:hypothetical protein
MRVFARRIEHPLDVAVQCPHDADAHHQFLLSLRQFHDVIGGIAQSYQLAPTRRQDGIIERAGPGGSGLGSCDQLSAFSDVPGAQVVFFFAASTVALSGQIVPLS